MIISTKLLTENCPAVSYIVSYYVSTTEHLPTTESCIYLLSTTPHCLCLELITHWTIVWQPSSQHSYGTVPVPSTTNTIGACTKINDQHYKPKKRIQSTNTITHCRLRHDITKAKTVDNNSPAKSPNLCSSSNKGKQL
jgi:hypothetical protein